MVPYASGSVSFFTDRVRSARGSIDFGKCLKNAFEINDLGRVSYAHFDPRNDMLDEQTGGIDMQHNKVRKTLALLLANALVSFVVLNPAIASVAGAPTTSAAKSTNTIVKISNPPNKKDAAQVIGQLVVVGSVTVNEKRAINGSAVFTESRIKVACARGNSAIVNLGRLGRVDLTPGTQMLLRFSDGLISGELIEGNANVIAPAGVKVSINTSEGVTASDGKDDAVIPVKTQRGVRCVPMVVSSASSSPALASGPLALMLLGVGGGAIAGVVASGQSNAVSSFRIGGN